VLIFLTW